MKLARLYIVNKLLGSFSALPNLDSWRSEFTDLCYMELLIFRSVMCLTFDKQFFKTSGFGDAPIFKSWVCDTLYKL